MSGITVTFPLKVYLSVLIRNTLVKIIYQEVSLIKPTVGELGKIYRDMYRVNLGDWERETSRK